MNISVFMAMWRRAIGVGAAMLMVAGCASTPPVETPPETETLAPVVAEAEAEPAAPEVQPKPRPEPHEYPVSPFTKDTLYELLVAEVAGYRGEYETALEKYVEMAVETRDPGVAARATRLAAYLKRDQAALTTAEIWAEEDPEDIDAHRHAANQLMRAGELEGAVTHLKAVKNLGGLADFPMVAYRAANLDDEGRQSLLKVLDHMLAEFPADQQLKFSRAVVLEQSGRLEESLAVSNELMAGENPDINVIILKVNTLKNLHRVDEALTFLEDAIEELEGHRRLRLIYARLLFEADRLADARRQYEIVYEQSPGDGDILFALALIAMEQGEEKVAEDYLHQMLRWNRRTGEAHFYLGSLAENQANVEEAIRHYKRAGDGYEYLPAQARIAELLVEGGRLEEARSWLENQRAQNPARHDQLVMVEAQLLNERGLEEPLFDLMDTAIEADPKNIDLLYYRAMVGQQFGRLDILERDLRRVIEIDPQNADALNALGYTLTDQTDRHEEALSLIERALAIRPNEAAFIDSMGWVMYRLQNYDEAIKHLRRALELFQNDEVAAHLGEVLWVTGAEEEARRVWQKALDLAPDSTILQKVIERFTGE